MGSAGFPSLGIPLNLAEPAYLEHVSYVFLFSFWAFEQNWQLCVDPLQFLNSNHMKFFLLECRRNLFASHLFMQNFYSCILQII